MRGFVGRRVKHANRAHLRGCGARAIRTDCMTKDGSTEPRGRSDAVMDPQTPQRITTGIEYTNSKKKEEERSEDNAAAREANRGRNRECQRTGPMAPRRSRIAPTR